ncbi:efflux RND transporter permease subunit [candidate division KSB1 bacterium]
MSLIRSCTRRPVAVAMLYMVIVSLGIYFLIKLPLEQLPADNVPQMSVSAVWTNTSAETVEAFVTSPIEGVCRTVKGVTEVSSTSNEGSSNVSLTMLKDTDMDFAMLELKEKLSVLKADLPSDVPLPQVRMYVPSNFRRQFTRPEPLRYTLTGSYTLEWIREYALENIRTPLVSLEGVGDVDIRGGQDPVLKIEVDPIKSEMYNIQEGAVSSVISSITAKRNIGYLMRSGTRYDVYVENTANDLSDLEDLVVVNNQGRFIKLKDIASFIMSHEEPKSYFRINNNPSVTVIIDHEDGINIISFVETVDKRIQELQEEFPPGLQIIQENDPSITIQSDLDNITARFAFCILVVFSILYVFLRNLKVPFVIMLAVGFSVLITVTVFYSINVGINVMSIAGTALAVGMLVDSSIVVVDNIYRYRERGEGPVNSADKGASEVFLPIVASVMTTSIVFLPVLYMMGDNKSYYIPMVLAVVFSLFASILVAFTFIPTFSLKIFPKDTAEILESIKKNRIVSYILDLYGRFIEYVIARKYWTLCTVVGIFLLSFWAFTETVPSYGGMPSSDQETYIGIRVSLPQGSVLDRANKIAESFEEMVIGREYIRKVVTNVSETSVTITIYFTDAALDTAFPYVLKDELTSYGSTFAGVRITVSGVGDYFSQGGFGTSSSVSFQVRVYGYNYNKVGDIAEDVGETFRRIGGRFQNVDTNFWGSSDRTDTIIKVKREDLAAYDLNVRTVINIISRYVRRSRLLTNTMIINDENIRYAVKIKDYEELQLEDLKNVLINTPDGGIVRLSQIADFDERKIIGSITRNNQQYERIVGLDYRGPSAKGKEIVDAVIEAQSLPNGYSLEEGYRSNYGLLSFREQLNKWAAILFAVILIYMVLASLFESLIHPLVIILTVPLALIGVFLIFCFMGKSFNDSAYIGVLLACGIVVNNSIILVDHINRLRIKGMELYPAVVQGCKDRVRPILMTSTTTIMGMLPLIIAGQSRGYDTKIWYSLALASIGGLLSATPLTLSVIPVLYILFEEWRRSLKSNWAKI